MKNDKIIKAKVTKPCIIPVGNRVDVMDTGNNFFLIVRAQTMKGGMASTNPMTLWIRRGEFEVIGGAR